MFANLISFEGRIRRAEFAITLILCYFVRSSLLAIFGELNLLSTISSVFLVFDIFSEWTNLFLIALKLGFVAIITNKKIKIANIINIFFFIKIS